MYRSIVLLFSFISFFSLYLLLLYVVGRFIFFSTFCRPIIIRRVYTKMYGNFRNADNNVVILNINNPSASSFWTFKAFVACLSPVTFPVMKQNRLVA